MRSFFGQLAAVPIRILVGVSFIFPMLDRGGLLGAIWFLTEDAEDGIRLINYFASKGQVSAAREKASEVFERCVDGRVAAAISLLEIQRWHNLRGAYEWIRNGREADCAYSERLLLAELLVSDHIEGYDTEQVIEEILGRKDLPMDYTRSALGVQAELFVRRGEWDSAEEIADRMLSIEDQIPARFIKWIVLVARGQEPEGFIKAPGMAKLNKGQKYSLMGVGYFRGGNKAKAIEFLHKAEEQGVSREAIVLMDGRVGELMDSVDYMSYGVVGID